MRIPVFKLAVLGTLVFLVTAGAAELSLYAEEMSTAEESVSSSTSSVNHAALQDKIARWKKLKEENPQEFQRQVEERKGRIKQQLRETQQKEPQRFEAFKRQASESRRSRLENLRRENPEMFQEKMSQRMQHFQNWKEKNPQAFQKFSQEHPQFSERIRNHEQHFRERFPQGVRQRRNIQGAQGEVRGGGERGRSGRLEPNSGGSRAPKNGDVYSRANRFQSETGRQYSGNANQSVQPEGVRGPDKRRPGNFPQQGMPNTSRGNLTHENAAGERVQTFRENRESRFKKSGFGDRHLAPRSEAKENPQTSGGFNAPHQRGGGAPGAGGHSQRESRRRGGPAGG